LTDGISNDNINSFDIKNIQLYFLYIDV
jgi:hypothetical protein